MGNATIYRQFPTKDALATAYVQGRADARFAWMRQAAEEPATAVVLDGATFGQRAVRRARLLIDDACPRLQAPATGSTIR